MEGFEGLGRLCRVTDKKILMSTLLKSNLDIIANKVKHDGDGVLIVDGEEGSGKSTLAQQGAYYLSHLVGVPFTIDNIVFSPKEFIEKVRTAQKNEVILYDEAFEDLSKWSQSAKGNMRMKSLFMQIRQKNLIFILVLPYFFELASYYAVQRAWYLLHCFYKPVEGADPLDFSKPVLRRGFFKFYSKTRKSVLYDYGKIKNKDYLYKSFKGDFLGYFEDGYIVDREAYKQKKLKAVDQVKIDKISEKDFVEYAMKSGMPVPVLKQYVSYSEVHLYRIKKAVEHEVEMVGTGE